MWPFIFGLTLLICLAPESKVLVALKMVAGAAWCSRNEVKASGRFDSVATEQTNTAKTP